jgi:hypothetical protein
MMVDKTNETGGDSARARRANARAARRKESATRTSTCSGDKPNKNKKISITPQSDKQDVPIPKSTDTSTYKRIESDMVDSATDSPRRDRRSQTSSERSIKRKKSASGKNKPTKKKRRDKMSSSPTSITQSHCDKQRGTTSSSPTRIITQIDEHAPSSRRYAYVDDIDASNKKIFQIIDTNTTQKELGRVMSEQKRRSAKKSAPLVMYEINSFNEENISLIRKLDGSREVIPNWFGRNRKQEPKASVNKKALDLLRQASEKAGISSDWLSNEISCAPKGEHKKTNIYKKEKLHFPTFMEPNEKLLRSAHSVLHKLLPAGDCESFHSVKVANQYYEYFRPEKVKIILLAESHVHTDEKMSKDGPIIGYNKMPSHDYDGPRDFISLVYCLGYGGDSILETRNDQDAIVIPDGATAGTPQFWKLFAACSGIGQGENGSYGDKVLKKSVKDDETRIQNKLDILLRLKQRGIWLIDTSIIGWYIQQPTEYNITQKSKNVHKLDKARPPSNMKQDTLVLSWELYIKHVVRKASNEGNLKLLIPIGNEVKKFITRERFEDAVLHDSSIVHDGIDAMNAWTKGKNGLDERLKLVENLINDTIGPYEPVCSKYA